MPAPTPDLEARPFAGVLIDVPPSYGRKQGLGARSSVNGAKV